MDLVIMEYTRTHLKLIMQQVYQGTEALPNNKRKDSDFWVFLVHRLLQQFISSINITRQCSNNHSRIKAMEALRHIKATV